MGGFGRTCGPAGANGGGSAGATGVTRAAGPTVTRTSSAFGCSAECSPTVKQAKPNPTKAMLPYTEATGLNLPRSLSPVGTPYRATFTTFSINARFMPVNSLSRSSRSSSKAN